mgnify:CR=1 FL=1
MTVGEPTDRGRGPSQAPGPPTPCDESPTPHPADPLRDGELVILGRIPTASNATLVCDAVLDGAEVRCVYKPERGEVPLWVSLAIGDFCVKILIGLAMLVPYGALLSVLRPEPYAASR